jgi:hypothetical protein
VTRSRWLDLLTICGLAGLLALVALTSPRWAPWIGSSAPPPTTEPGADPGPASTPLAEASPVERKISVTLFFPSPDRPGLALEERTVAFSGDLARQVQVVVEEVLHGSATGLLSPLPSGARVLDVFVGAGGVAYVSLEPLPPERDPLAPVEVGDETAEASPTPSPTEHESPVSLATELGIQGSSEELLSVFSIVDSVVINLPAVRRVQLLIRGEPVSTLAGHIDISRPLAADATLLVGLGPDLSPAPTPEGTPPEGGEPGPPAAAASPEAR